MRIVDTATTGSLHKFFSALHRKSLVEPRQLLLDALEMLKDETHENLPEGQLRLQVKETLAQLESFMKTIGYEF